MAIAPLSIVFNAGQLASQTLRGPKRIVLDTLEVDCTLSESYDYEAEVTEFEVEKGAKVSDHRRLAPASFSISGVISDTPLPSDLVIQAVAAAAPQLGLALSAFQTTVGLTGDAIFTRDAFNKLERLYTVGRETLGADGKFSEGTFSIVTKFRTFENMVVKSLKIARESGTGLALPFTATFREIRFVESAIGTFQAVPQLQGPNPQGSQGGESASKKIVDDGKTLLKRGIDSGLPGTLDRAKAFVKERLLIGDLQNVGKNGI